MATLTLFHCDLFDILPPKIEIISPKADTVYFGTLPCEIKATDNRKVTKVEIFLDGEPVHEFTKEPYKTDIGLDQINASSITLQAAAHDKAGNHTEASREVSLSLGLRLTSPIGGETWAEQSNQTITWESSGNVGGTVSLHYSIDGGSTWDEITGSTANNGTYTWTLPNFIETQSACKIRVSTGQYADDSDDTFTISTEPNTFTLTSPNGGESWREQSTHDITWSYGGDVGDQVSLHYSLYGGSNWTEITASTANDGSHPWTLPNLTETQTTCRVKVVGTTSGFADTSDADFAIEDIPFSDQVQKLLAADAEADDGFGLSVALSGDYAIVGAWREDAGGNEAGAVYVFMRTGLSSWDSGTKLVAPDAEADDWFGISVALSGDYAIVGAHGEDTGGDAAGAAYVFYRIGANSWDGGTKLLATDAQAGDMFGNSVAISGDYAIVGAYGEDAGGDRAGAAYVFQCNGANSWDGGTKLLAPDAGAGDWFGISVALSGDYALVGAPYNDTRGGNAGAAYVFFQRTGPGNWDGGTRLMADDAGTDDRFGLCVALDGAYALVGVPKEDTGGNDAGAVYVFESTGPGSWDGGTMLLADDAGTNDRFGQAVALSGDYALVGAPYNSTGGYAAGAAYVFQRTGPGSWDSSTKLLADDAQDYDWFGYSVALSGDYALVGADGEDAGGNYAGAAYIFR